MFNHLWKALHNNIREEKTLLGSGQAQARNPNSAENLPAFVAAMYGLLHLTSQRTTAKPNMLMLPRPKWDQKEDIKRITTVDLLNNLRAKLLAKATELNFSDFVNMRLNSRSLRYATTCNASAAFYMRN